jgi:hypothetical protein
MTQTETDVEPLVQGPEETPNSWLVHNKRVLYKAAAVLFVFATLVFVAVFVLTVVPCKRSDVPTLQTECFRYTHLNESQQPTVGCERALAGNCSTMPGVCVAFAFLEDTNASTVVTGSMYRCGDPTCTKVSDACRCANPAIGRVTEFCRRHVVGKEYSGANFACF